MKVANIVDKLTEKFTVEGFILFLAKIWSNNKADNQQLNNQSPDCFFIVTKYCCAYSHDIAYMKALEDASNNYM